MDISKLNSEFSIANQLEFYVHTGNIAVVKITNKYASALVSLYGAHVMSYIPTGNDDLLWMSKDSFFEEGKPIRGGIPVCFPWFGPHATDNTKALHGFARLMNWDVKETNTLESGATKLVLVLNNNVETLDIWPYPYKLEMSIIIGKKLEVKLKVSNTGNEVFIYSAALHSYFHVADISKVKIQGLKDYSYYNGLDKDTIVKQDEDFLKICKEENRRYFNHLEDCIIYDNEKNRKIQVAKKGSKITLIWNPWLDTAKKMPDFPDDGYKNMLCIEAVNYYDDCITLKPKESFEITAIINEA